MNFIEKINIINDPTFKTKIRNLEKIKKKIINSQYSTVFNETCLKEELYPKYKSFS